MSGRLVLEVAAALSLGLLSGCGSSSAPKVGNSYSTARPAVITTPKRLGLKKKLDIVNAGSRYAFKPRIVTVNAGAIITWKNESRALHTVTFDGRGLPSVSVAPGKTVAADFTRGGTFAYHCTIHPYMKGVIIVKAR